jgi:hypothetical protein
MGAAWGPCIPREGDRRRPTQAKALFRVRQAAEGAASDASRGEGPACESAPTFPQESPADDGGSRPRSPAFLADLGAPEYYLVDRAPGSCQALFGHKKTAALRRFHGASRTRTGDFLGAISALLRPEFGLASGFPSLRVSSPNTLPNTLQPFSSRTTATIGTEQATGTPACHAGGRGFESRRSRRKTLQITMFCCLRRRRRPPAFGPIPR